MKIIFLSFTLVFSCLYAGTRTEEALKELIQGNQRFTTEQSIHPDRVAERRLETAAKQEPFATIMGCSDSRVASEILFDSVRGKPRPLGRGQERRRRSRPFSYRGVCCCSMY